MKYFSLLLAFSLVACSDKAAQSGATTGTTPTTAVESGLKDSSQVANARTQLVEQLKKARDAYLEKLPEEGQGSRDLVKRAYGAAIESVSTQPASSGKELEAFAQAKYQEAKKTIFDSVRAALQAQLIARTNPEPLPGEKREAVQADGQCTNDLIVDVQRFEIFTFDTYTELQNLQQNGGPLASVRAKLAAESLFTRCDEFLDRYDPNAVCKFTLPGQEEQIQEVKMTEIKEECDSFRKTFSNLE